MRIINDQIYFKILFFGTALAGKTTCLTWLYNNLIPSDMKATTTIRSVNTSFGQTMLFDFVPVKVTSNINFRFFTTTGQDYYASTRKMLFQDVDGVFYVVDSQKKELQHNKEIVEEFFTYVTSFYKSRRDLIIIVLYNKQDLPEIYPAKFLATELKLTGFPSYETCALSGHNLKPAFLRMVKRCLKRLDKLSLPNG